MKSLKRTLSLVLALVMVLGLFGGISMSAAASDFTDDEEIQYKEAVDVMTGIGAINGYEEGDSFSFKPKDTITRAEAAKLVTYAILGKATADQLTGVTSSFTDVDANDYDWAVPSIEYLVNRGVIDGRGDGTFDPKGEVTGYEVGKMLLCALGYGAKGEYTGDGWDFRVALDGAKQLEVSITGKNDATLSVFSGRDKDSATALSGSATREEVALYCFNTIQICQVEYISTLDIYVGATSDLGNKLGSIADIVYPTLEVEGAKDDYSRPAQKWTYEDEQISLHASKPILNFANKAVKENALIVAAKNEGYKCAPSATTPIPANTAIVLNNSENAKPADGIYGGNGITVEVYGGKDNGEKVVTKIVMIQTTLSAVENVKTDNAATTTVDERELVLTGGYTANPVNTEGFDTVYEAASALFDAGKDIPVTVVTNPNPNAADASEKVAVKIGIPQTTDVKVSSVKTNTSNGAFVSLVADGKTYEASDAYVKTDEIAAGNEMTLIMDADGYILTAKTVSAADNIGLVLATGSEPAIFGAATAKAKLLDLEGKEMVMSVVPGTNNWGTEGAGLVNHFVKYTPQTGADEGKFKLVDANTINPLSGSAGDANGPTNDYSAISIVNNKAYVTYADKTKVDANDGNKVKIDGNGQTVTANEKTVFIVQTLTRDNNDKVTNSSYTVYNGIKEVPSMGGQNYAIAEKNGVASAIFVMDSKVEGAGTKSLAFVAVDSSRTITLADKTTVYNAALIEGTKVTDIQISTETAKKLTSPTPIITSYTEKDGVITDVATLASQNTTGNVAGRGFTVKKAANGIITIGGDDAHTYADDCVVWEIDSSKTDPAERFTTKTVAQLKDSTTYDEVFHVYDVKTGEISAMYIVKSPVALLKVVIDTGDNHQLNAAKDAWAQADSKDINDPITVKIYDATTGDELDDAALSKAKIDFTLNYVTATSQEETEITLTNGVGSLPAVADDGAGKNITEDAVKLTWTATCTGGGYANASGETSVAITVAAA